MTVASHPSPAPFEHDALLYGSDEEYAGVLAPLLTASVAACAPTIVVVPEARASLLSAAIGPASKDIQFLPAEEAYRNPAATLARYTSVLRALTGGPRPFVVGEVQFGPDPGECAAWTRYEAAANRVLAPFDVRAVCPYDTRSLPTAVLEDARRTHPNLVEESRRRVSEQYVAPESLLLELPRSTEPPSRQPDLVYAFEERVVEVRRAFREAIASAGFSPARIEELTLGFNEVVTNAIVHGGGRAQLRLWSGRRKVTCVVDDDGPGSDDPFLGFAPPPQLQEHGYGLWLVRQAFDATEFGRSPSGGFSATLSARRDARRPPDGAAA